MRLPVWNYTIWCVFGKSEMRTIRISVNGRCKTFGVLVIKSASGQISPLTRVNPFNRFVQNRRI